MIIYDVLITGSLDSGKYTLLSGLSNSQPQVKTLKFKDAQNNEHIVDLAYQEIKLSQSKLCAYVMSDELVAEIQNSGFLSSMDAVILCLDANKDSAQSDLSTQLKVLHAQGVDDRLSIRMKTSASLSASKKASIIDVADRYHIAEELIELVYPDHSDNVAETVKTVLDFHLEDIVQDALTA